MRVIVPPVIVGGRICRVIAPVPALLEVQEWFGDSWHPSDVLLSTAIKGERAALALLHSLGVPRGDHSPWPRRAAADFTEAALIARASRSPRVPS